MKKENEQPDADESWENEPAYLSHSQREDPIDAISFIANWEPLYSMRDRLKDMFMAAMYSDHWKGDSPERKGEWVWFFGEMMDLLELAYLLDSMIKDNKISFSHTSESKADR